MVLWSNSGISSAKAHDFAFSDSCVFQRRAAGRRCCAPTISAARPSIFAASCLAGLPSIAALGWTASPSLRSSSMAPPASRAGASSSPWRMPRRAKMLQPMLLRGGPSKENVRSGAPRASASLRQVAAGGDGQAPRAADHGVVEGGERLFRVAGEARRDEERAAVDLELRHVVAHHLNRRAAVQRLQRGDHVARGRRASHTGNDDPLGLSDSLAVG